MATVYLADDIKHDRPVAIKVLRPELAAQLGHERFLREITTTARLRHPNILPLFDSGEADGQVFYVMPYVEGETLRDRMTRDGTLPVADVLRIADEVADALSYAHGRGVIHRDIKPENILIESDHAIVADFGIAHAASTAGDASLTLAGMALGTPHYMSPEQGSGDVVDARSDLYALACVIYEMLSGKPPFTAPTPMAVLVRHAVEPVPSIAISRPDLPATLVTAIERALAKAPDDRYPTIQAWREALKQSAASPAVPAAAAFHKPPPVPATPLLGRENDLAQAIERVTAGARVLTITGYGGTGKTRFAIELFRRLERNYAGGAAFISLASVTAAADVAPAIGMALGIMEAHGRTAVDALATVIGDRPALLVLDNLEQVLDASRDIAAFSARCPRLQVIATSRAPLKIGAESEFVLPPLALPAEHATIEAMREVPSVALFLQRAEKVKPGFSLTTANAPSVAAICRQLDGLPLALELAAARVRILEPAALLQRLDHALDLLTSGDRDLPLRQRTLRATISWSYSLLEKAEQLLLCKLSVFHEGWTLEAMEQVGYGEADRHRALDELDSLVEKGLVRVIRSGERYALLETVRAFAAEQLHASGQVSQVRRAHADYFLAFGKQVDADIRGTAQLAAVGRGRSDIANLYAALNWLIAAARTGDEESLEKGLLLAGHLNWFWHIGGQHLTARVAVDALLALAVGRAPSPGRGRAFHTDSMISTVTGEWDRCIRSGRNACNDGLALGDDVLAAEGLMYVGYASLHLGQMAEAGAALDESIARSRPVTEFILSMGTAIKGVLHFATGDVDAGIALVEQALVMTGRRGDYEQGGVALSLLAQMTYAKGDHAKAMAQYRQALAALETVGDRPEVARVLCELGWTILASGDGPEAGRTFQLAVREYEAVGSPKGTGLALMGLAAVEAAAGRTERAVSIAAAADALSKRAGIVVDHTMDPGVGSRIEALKATIPKRTLDGLVANASELTPAAVLAMVGEE